MNSLLKRVTWLAFGTLLSQIILMMTLPIITRSISPTDFGIYSLAMVVVAIFSTIIPLRMELAISTQKQHSKALRVVSLALFNIVALGSASFTIYLLLQLFIPFFELKIAILIFVISILTAFVNISRFWATRIGLEKFAAITRSVKTIICSLLQIALLKVGFGVFGMLIAQAVSVFIIVCLLPIILPVKYIINKFSLNSLAETFKCNIDFFKYSTPALIVSLLGTQLPIPTFYSLYTPASAGTYAFVIGLLSIPATLFGSALGMVLYREINKRIQSNSDIKIFITRIILILATLSIAGFSWLSHYSDVLIPFIFGSDWGEAAVVIQHLLPWFILSFISSPISTIPIAFNKQKKAMYINYYESVLRLAAIFLGYKLGGYYTSVALLGWAGCVICLVYIIWIFRLLKLNVKEFMKLSILVIIIFSICKCSFILFDLISKEQLVTSIFSLAFVSVSSLFFIYKHMKPRKISGISFSVSE